MARPATTSQVPHHLTSGRLGPLFSLFYRFGPPRKTDLAASRALVVRLGVCCAAALNVMIFSLCYYAGLAPRDGDLYTAFGRWSFVLATIAVIAGGWLFFRSAWQSLRTRVAHLDLPIALGIALGYGGSTWAWLRQGPEAAYFDTITIFVALMVLGRWLQERVLQRNRHALLASDGVEDLFTRRRRGSELETVPAATIEPGDELWIPPGDLVPVASKLLGAPALLSLDWIDGESRPLKRDERKFALNLPYQQAAEKFSHADLRKKLVREGLLPESFRFLGLAGARKKKDGTDSNPEDDALVRLPAWQELRKALTKAGLEAEWIDQGCSGMAGTYGMSRRNFRNSMRAGRPLLTRLGQPGLTLFEPAFADELAPQGVLVNAVLPGDIDSAMWMGPGGVAEQVAAAEGITPEEVVAMAGELYPIGRIGKVEEVASVIVFLCSELAGNVVGVAWSVDGGYVRTAL